jgi:hypothetical protein
MSSRDDAVSEISGLLSRPSASEPTALELRKFEVRIDTGGGLSRVAGSYLAEEAVILEGCLTLITYPQGSVGAHGYRKQSIVAAYAPGYWSRVREVPIEDPPHISDEMAEELRRFEDANTGINEELVELADNDARIDVYAVIDPPPAAFDIEPDDEEHEEDTDADES